MPSIWSALETVPNHAAVPAIWRAQLGEAFELFRDQFLRRSPTPASGYPCPRLCGCTHRVVVHGADDIVAVCDCEGAWDCEEIVLKKEDVVVYEFDLRVFGLAVARAFGVHPRDRDLALINTRQIGACGSDAVPLILTVQHGSVNLRRVVSELAVLLGGRFILVMPTTRLLDASTQILLKSAKVSVVSLESTVILLPQGSLRTIRPVSELLADFLPAAKEPLPEDVARCAFQLVATLDDDRPMKKPTLLTVFRLYCIKGLTAEQIARKCSVSKGTVINRMRLLGGRLGGSLDDFRSYSPQFEKIEDDIAASRAPFIHRKGMIYGDRASEDDDG